MRLVVDVSLPPELASALVVHGHEAVHWQDQGPKDTKDLDILRWAARERRTIITHDLDFGDLLAWWSYRVPSVIIVREDRILNDTILDPLLKVLDQHAEDILEGCVISMNIKSARVRKLPVRGK